MRRLSIIIPTLNEATILADTVAHARTVADEVCVTDGGSTDGTVDLARELGVTVVEGPAGRGGQLNRGARATSGEVLLFLHADTRLPPDARSRIEQALDEGAVGGGFHVRYESGPRWLTGWGNRWIHRRTALTRRPLGDQCQFVLREAFQALDGFRDWPILEDLDLVHRLHAHGTVAVIDAPVSTSPRRFERQGMVRTVAGNWLIWGLYLAGASPRRLARLYRHIR